MSIAFRLLALAAAVTGASAAESGDNWKAMLAEHAGRFAERVTSLTTVETLVQRAYNLPPHPHLVMSSSARPVYAQYIVHELVSEYNVGPLPDGQLVERREMVSLDGKPLQARKAAQEALARLRTTGGASARKEMLKQLTRLGLVDVATEYALLLLVFTPQEQARLEWADAGEEFVGVEETHKLHWSQATGGALEFRNGKTTLQRMSGFVWVRKSDGAPLRVTAMIDHVDGGREIRDDATIDYEFNRALGSVVAASAVHRHYLDGRLLTENLYTYAPFHLFVTDTRIEYEKPKSPK